MESKNRKKKHLTFFLTVSITLILFTNLAYSQAELEPWGNITGVRKQGQLFEFESSLKIVGKDGKVQSTAKEKQRPHFKRNKDEQIVTSAIDSLFFKESVKDIGESTIKVTITLMAHADIDVSGIYFCITFPKETYSKNLFHIHGTSAITNRMINVDAASVSFNSKSRQFSLSFDEPPAVISIKKDTASHRSDQQLWVTLSKGVINKGDSVKKSFEIVVSGDIDKSPVNLTLNTTQQGRPFDGLGGNFRLQNPKGDPQVIDYCLKNLRVAWGRVEMPWRFWQPDKDTDPIAKADSGKLHPAVKNAMQMAHRLDSMGIPLVLTAWFPPDWAAEGKVNFRPVNGIWGNPLNKDNMAAIYKSIADYIQYLKTKYGFEPKFFSFNESDLGINVRVTSQEHDDFIKGCGAYFETRGLKTKMLLGDNSDATTYKFIDNAMDDPAAKPYIGAVSFHSWRGWETPTLQKWADAAAKTNLPLLVGEGSTDAAAYSYPDIFQEQTYALKEINLYMRLLSICQPLSILQWQLTSDYSPLIGGGIFGNKEPLHPGQRFWNLKQLSITPKGLFFMPINCDKSNISCAALGDNAKCIYAVHIVNNGTERKVTLSGLPVKVKTLKMYTTSKASNMKQGSTITVTKGKAEFKIPATCYTTLISK